MVIKLPYWIFFLKIIPFVFDHQIAEHEDPCWELNGKTPKFTFSIISLHILSMKSKDASRLNRPSLSMVLDNGTQAGRIYATRVWDY